MPRATRKLVHSRGANPMADKYCESCDKEFSRPSELKRHYKQTLIHNPNARRFKCRFCDKVQTQKCNIRTHESTHTKQKECCGLPVESSGTLKECMFACSDPSSMRRHMIGIHLAPYLSRGLPVPEWLKQGQQARLATKSASRRAPRLSTALSSSSSPPEFPRLESSTPTLPGTPLPITPTEIYELPVSTQNVREVDDAIITSNTLTDLDMDLINFNFNCDPNQLLGTPGFAVPQNEEPTFDPATTLFSQAVDVEFFQYPLPQFGGEQPSNPSELSNIGDLIFPAEATVTHFGDVDFTFAFDGANQMNYQIPLVGDRISPPNLFSPMGPEVQLDLYTFP